MREGPFLLKKKSDMDVQQTRVEDMRQVCESHMKSKTLRNPTVLTSTAQMYDLMIGTNMLITISRISSYNEFLLV